MKQIVAFTASPAGIAHARLAAEALRAVATYAGHAFKAEIASGAIGSDPITSTDIAAADVILLAVDAAVDTTRFEGKPVYETRTSTAIRNPQAILEAALARVVPKADAASQSRSSEAKPVNGSSSSAEPGSPAAPTAVSHDGVFGQLVLGAITHLLAYAAGIVAVWRLLRARFCYPLKNRPHR